MICSDVAGAVFNCSDATGFGMICVIVAVAAFNCDVVAGDVIAGVVAGDATGFCMICPAAAAAAAASAALSFLNAASTASAKAFAPSAVVMGVVRLTFFKLVIALYKSLDTGFFSLSKRRSMLCRMDSAAATNVEPHELSSDDLSMQVL